MFKVKRDLIWQYDNAFSLWTTGEDLFTSREPWTWTEKKDAVSVLGDNQADPSGVAGQATKEVRGTPTEPEGPQDESAVQTKHD